MTEEWVKSLLCDEFDDDEVTIKIGTLRRIIARALVGLERNAARSDLDVAAEMCEGEALMCSTADGRRVAENCASLIRNFKLLRSRVPR